MKKCASCSKDLPEAALHCVFCGAKQAPVPAVQPSAVAKTAFGYSANEVMQQLGNQLPPQSYQPPQQPSQRPQPPSQPPPLAQPPSYQRQQAPSRPPPLAQPYQQPSGLAPVSTASAATVMVSPGGAPPQQNYGSPQQNYGNPSPGYGGQQYGGGPAPSAGYGGQQNYGGQHNYGGAQQAYSPPGGGMGIHSPQQATPQPLPAAPNPYLGAHTGAARSGQPVEPWRDSLKLMMFVWGAALLAGFVTPIMTDPMAFNWDAIIHAPGEAKIPALLWASIGLLSIVFAAIPIMTLPRGLLAAGLGLAGIVVPMALSAFPDWKHLLPLAGGLVLVPGLLVRNEYTESLLPRVLVTIGVICMLVPFLIPEHDQIPLVMIFKGLIEAPGELKVVFILLLVEIVLVVMCLLVWMPGPATAAAKTFAWAVILYPVLVFVVGLIMKGHLSVIISKAPGKVMEWVQPVAYSVLIGYGLAAVFGKQLE